MKQQCHISFVYSSWLLLVLGITFYLFLGHYLQALLWLLFVPLFLWLYVRYFPSLSRYMGYGSVEDQPAVDVARTAAAVKLYTGLGCPFCPIVKRRLTELQSKMAFDLHEVDVTFKPELLVSKGIRALPVVEIDEARWVGNGTEQTARTVHHRTCPSGFINLQGRFIRRFSIAISSKFSYHTSGDFRRDRFRELRPAKHGRGKDSMTGVHLQDHSPVG